LREGLAAGPFDERAQRGAVLRVRQLLQPPADDRVGRDAQERRP
jgi:hypothetical protein